MSTYVSSGDYDKVVADLAEARSEMHRLSLGWWQSEVERDAARAELAALREAVQTQPSYVVDAIKDRLATSLRRRSAGSAPTEEQR